MTSLVGEDRFLEMRAAPTEVDGVAIAFSDITERKIAEQHRKLLIDELNHRVKNTLAVVQSIAAQTFKDSVVSPELRASYEGRLMALSRAHGLLTRESWESAPLRQLLNDAISPFNMHRFDMRAADLRLAPKPAVSLVLALHELATNATKYGALSNDGGKVTITCAVETEEIPMFRLVWMERGGPAVTPPAARGFGSRLIERGLAAELGGHVVLDYASDGLVCTIEAPLSNMEST
jgi:two-component sensor histidine kinase